MKKIIYLLLTLIIFGCQTKKETENKTAVKSEISEFPIELVNFSPYNKNPVFSGTGTNTWDKTIRERGYILRTDSIYHLWYTGYNDSVAETKFLGYATSKDGLNWTHFPDNPLFNESWVEDMQVIINNGIFYMFAEGQNDVAKLLTSTDGIHWEKKHDLHIYNTQGESIEAPYGTPTAWVENGKWYLFYERNDAGIWLAESTDLKNWTNVQDDPVISMGPENYDQHAVAMNQIIKYKGKYYAYYHASGFKPWRDWTTNVAMSTDLIHWKKYSKNPIISGNKSSGILVNDGSKFRLYTMHPDVNLYFSK